jgi:hypothetical protein
MIGCQAYIPEQGSLTQNKDEQMTKSHWTILLIIRSGTVKNELGSCISIGEHLHNSKLSFPHLNI